MSNLPPEILSRIFELAVPSATFDTYEERYSDLSSFALVSRAWQHPAQRLIFKDCTIEMLDEYDGGVCHYLDMLQSTQDRFATRHLRARGPDGNPGRRPAEIILDDGESLSKHLSASVTAMVELTRLPPALRFLSLRQVYFDPSDPNPQEPLKQLTDLSFVTMEGALPFCLLPAQLPALQRLSIRSSRFRPRSQNDDDDEDDEDEDSFSDEDDEEEDDAQDDSHWKEQYSFTNIVALIPRLDFFSCETFDSNCWRRGVSAIASKTLFDLAYESNQDFDSSSIKHVRIIEKLVSKCSPWDESWDLKKVKNLTTKRFPNLETLVASKSWEKCKIFGEVKSMLEKQKLTLLLDENDAEEYEDREMHISEAFKDHRRRVANV